MMEILATTGGVLLFILILVVMIGGLILSLFNSLGTWVIFIATFVAGLIDGFDRISWPFYVVFFMITLLSTFIDNLTMLFGAKKMGAGKWGMLGAFTGGIIGLLIGNVLGMIIGPFIGATIFEFIFAHKDLKPSLKAGFGTFIGFISAIILKFGVGVAMIVTWIYLWFR
jgi:uncharacterized protein YqgC (DUF456 family)